MLVLDDVSFNNNIQTGTGFHGVRAYPIPLYPQSVTYGLLLVTLVGVLSCDLTLTRLVVVLLLGWGLLRGAQNNLCIFWICFYVRSTPPASASARCRSRHTEQVLSRLRGSRRPYGTDGRRSVRALEGAIEQ